MATRKTDTDATKPVSTDGSNQYSDPTYNVLQLVNAQVVRLNDLREVQMKCNEEKDLLHKEIMNLHVSYGEKLAKAESDRINAIRSVDVGAVAIASERAVGQASVLANQLTTTAETLRNLVNTTAATTATQLQQLISPLVDRISMLEQGRSQGVGKTQASKDMMDMIKLVIAIAAFFLGYFVLKN